MESIKSPFSHHRNLKYISLIILTFQNAILLLSMRYSRTKSGDKFLEGTVVLMTEVVKLVTCLFLVYRSPDEAKRNSKKFFSMLHKTIILNKMDTLKVCVPSFIYLVDNNLLYVAVEHLDVAVWHFQEIQEKWFFFGYDPFVVYLISLNAMGGLTVAVVVKYSDNILKGFATSLAIIITCFMAIFLFGFEISLQFTFGAFMVIGSIFLYGYNPNPRILLLPTSTW